MHTTLPIEPYTNTKDKRTTNSRKLSTRLPVFKTAVPTFKTTVPVAKTTVPVAKTTVPVVRDQVTTIGYRQLVRKSCVRLCDDKQHSGVYKLINKVISRRMIVCEGFIAVV